jgi:hypothetical protein
LLFGKLPYDPAKDVAYVTMVATQPSALARGTFGAAARHSDAAGERH